MFRKAALTVALGFTVALALTGSLSARALDKHTGLPGAQINRTTVLARQSDQYTIYFLGGETASVEIAGDGSTLLELYVYDSSNNFLFHQVGPRPWVRFTPRGTGAYRVKIINRGEVNNDYVLRTN